MLRALFRKEWKQLRMLRWVGVGIGVLAPFLLLALAAAGGRGWILGPVSSASAPTVVQDLLPMLFALALWPLLALMAVVHALTADRADGTADFLLERPVPRIRVWGARLAAALGTAVAVFASHTVVWWLSVLSVGNATTFVMGDVLERLIVPGLTFSLVAFLAGAAAGAFVRTPMQGVLLGLVFTAIPVAVGSVLSGMLFLGYRIGGVRIGLGVPVLLLAGYLVCSYAAECRGEPAGRRRLRRGLVAVGSGLIAMPLFLAASAPIVMRTDARLHLGNARSIPSPVGGSTFVLNNYQRAAWLIDTQTREKLRFFAPPVFDAAWSDDGKTLAVLHAAGTGGRMLDELRLQLVDRDGSERGSPAVCSECRAWWGTGIVWSGTRVVVPAGLGGGQGLVIFDTATAKWSTVPLPPTPLPWRLMKAPDTGELRVLRFLRGEGGNSEASDAELHPLDVNGATLGPPVLVPDAGHPYSVAAALSPSGVRWLRRARRPGEPMRVVDLTTGESEVFSGRSAVWLAGDRLCWTRRIEEDSTEVRFGLPGASRTVRTFPPGWVHLVTSPDLRRVLVSHRPPGEDSLFERWLYDPEADRWQPASIPNDRWSVEALQWAGPARLATFGPRSLGVVDASNPGEVLPVIGRPSS